MLILFQKFHTQPNLTLLTLLGLSCGLLTSALLGSFFTPIPHWSENLSPKPVSEPAATSIADLNLILQRNIFDPSGRSSETFDPGMRSATATEQTAEIQQVDMSLLGTVVANDKSLALILSGTQLDIYHLNDKLPNGGQIEEIQRNLVKIRNRDRTLTTLESTEATSSPSSASPTPRRSNTAEGVKQVSDNSWVVSKETIEATRQNMAEELRLAQMQPRIVEGKTDGFMIRTIKRNSFLNKLGLRRGDVILSVNSIALDSPEKALQVFQQLREARQINVAVERQGEALIFAYELD